MIILNVSCLPLQDVVGDLAREMNTKPVKNCDEVILSIPDAFGEGEIRGIDFRSGLGIVIYDVTFKDDVELRFTRDDLHPAKFLFCTEGSLGHKFENEIGINHLEKYQNSIVASTGHNGHVLLFKKGEHVKISSLEIHRKAYLNQIRCELDTVHSSLQEMMRDVEAEKMFYYSGNYSLELASSFISIEKFEKNGLLRHVFLEAKSSEMLALQLMQYEDDMQRTDNRVVLRKSEQDQVKMAIRIVQEELPENLLVDELASRVGIHPKKLQTGFKAYTGRTVNQYIQDARLDSAKELLISSELSISEISYSVGFTNQSYFTSKFKERYSVAPGVFRKKRGRTVQDGK